MLYAGGFLNTTAISMSSQIKIGSRKSKLAIAQAEEVKAALLKNCPKLSADDIELKTFTTTGDKIQSKNLSEVGGKGLFTKEIEEALLAKEIDIAVHSVKDLPADSPKGLVIKAVLKRLDPSDAFISKKHNSLENLPKGTVIGTSSLRRKSLLLNKYPHLKIVNLRGNVNTRLAKLEAGEIEGTILASCGLMRIDMQVEITEKIPYEDMLPAIGQGAICAECREDDLEVIELLKKINHRESEICINSERAFLSEIDGSCRTPIAALATLQNQQIHLQTLVADPEGVNIYKLSESCGLDEGERLGRDLALQTKKEAQEILALIVR
jgi:hydroxymethylbilane synthase